MKALFYFPINIDIYPDSGIIKKNKYIVSAAKNLGVNADMISFSNLGIHLNDALIKKIPNLRLARGLYNNIFAYNVVKSLDFSAYNFVWIRTGLCLPPFLKFLRHIKRKNPQIQIILEYGAYPFKNELTGHLKILYPISEYLEKYLKEYASNVITYCGQDEVLGIPNIKIENGVDVKLIKWVEQAKPLNSALHLISVSSLMPWHACDRIIYGIKQYYNNNSQQKTDIVFHIVGKGQESENLKKIVTDLNLSDQVIFHDHKVGKELDEVFKQSQLAVGTLGMHRINLNACSSLKNREYFARGLPLVLSTKDFDFPEELPFVKYLSPDESPIDIAALIRFYKDVVDNYPDYPRLIRKYAEEHLTWESKIKQVLKVVEQ